MLTLNYKDVARKNIEMVDKLAIFNRKSFIQFHYANGVGCAIGICDPKNQLDNRMISVTVAHLLNTIKTNNINILTLIQNVHDYRFRSELEEAALYDCVSMQLSAINSPKLNEVIKTVKTPKDLDKDKYCQIMKTIIDYC